MRHTPIHSQIWVGVVAGVLAGLFNVHVLSHILSVGSLVCFSDQFSVLKFRCRFFLFFCRFGLQLMYIS